MTKNKVFFLGEVNTITIAGKEKTKVTLRVECFETVKTKKGLFTEELHFFDVEYKGDLSMFAIENYDNIFGKKCLLEALRKTVVSAKGNKVTYIGKSIMILGGQFKSNNSTVYEGERPKQLYITK